MKQRPISILTPIFISCLLFFSRSFAASSTTLPKGLNPSAYDRYIAKELDWQPDNNPANECHGYYFEPAAVSLFPHPNDAKTERTIITADGPTTLVKQGISILRKNVVVIQAGRMLQADTAYLYRNAKGQIDRIKLVGHVHLREPNKLIVSDVANISLDPKNSSVETTTLNHATYHLYRPGAKAINGGGYDGFGTAQYEHRNANNVMTLLNATYSTCNPTHPSWQISAKKMVIDNPNQEAKAYGAVIRFKNVPVLYTPYYSFSLSHKRKTGFLMPTYGYTDQSGHEVSAPFYWNMAPNVDWLITPFYFSSRGARLDNEFRYLTDRNAGSIYLAYMPHDTNFNPELQGYLNTYTSPNAAPYRQQVSDLMQRNGQRGFFSMTNHTWIDQQWQSDLYLNYVSDPYYFTDLDNQPMGDMDTNQLLNQLDIRYTGINWRFYGMAQAYQTLHKINQVNFNNNALFANQALDPYMRLPELRSFAYYPDVIKNTDFYLGTQFTNFEYDSLVLPNSADGQRLHLRPGVETNFADAAGYLKPGLWLDTTGYTVQNPQPGQALSSGRILPMVDVDGGLYLNRDFSFAGHNVTQTLEPRVFYLYVPYESQNNLPNFDTVLLPFSFEQLFSLNRYTGYDRVENANQTSFGLTSRIYDDSIGTELLQTDLGVIYYFSNPRVCLSTGCPIVNRSVSPIVSDVTLTPNSILSATLSYAYDPVLNYTDNAAATVYYHPNNYKVISLGYNFVHSNANSISINSVFNNQTGLYTESSNNVTGGLAWPLFNGISAMGYTSYDMTQKHLTMAYAGLQYDTCCWAARFVFQRSYVQSQTNANGTVMNTFSNGYYFQLILKGLGAFGQNSTSTLLQNTIPGFTE